MKDDVTVVANHHHRTGYLLRLDAIGNNAIDRGQVGFFGCFQRQSHGQNEHKKAHKSVYTKRRSNHWIYLSIQVSLLGIDPAHEPLNNKGKQRFTRIFNLGGSRSLHPQRRFSQEQQHSHESSGSQ
jgi:hypothetical protein